MTIYVYDRPQGRLGSVIIDIETGEAALIIPKGNEHAAIQKGLEEIEKIRSVLWR
jgi:hypothetical protein